jgi:soluble lytic murein transglycosylase
LLIAIPVVIVVAIVTVVALAVSGRLVIPGVSARVYPLKYSDEIAAAAEKYDVDPYLIAAVARTESSFNPDAESGVGAVGLMQFLPSTAEWVTTLDAWKGPKAPVLTDPADSLELGACYLSYLLNRFDSRTAAIAAYNAGPNKVASWVKQAGGEDGFGVDDIAYTETKNFVQRVDRWQKLFEKAHPDAFGG